jgi:3alpha(or 20beta)-hydroxysteroid dehydrogenase
VHAILAVVTTVSEPRVVIVTGAARGQGLAIVKRLRRDGFTVVAADVLDGLDTAVDELADDGVVSCRLDVTSEADWHAAVSTVETRFGGLDALVNNAGILHRSFIGDETPADFERLWRVNCFGAFLGIQHALPLLDRRAGACVVNNCSTSAIRAFPNHASYSASKWALRGLTQSAAADLAPLGIRVNGIFPGPVATPMHDAATNERLAGTTLLGRSGTPQDVADIVAYLLSPAASFLTGAEIVIDGGQLLKAPTSAP